ncbi:MAG: Xaa-Pro peptidase family protein [Pseudomonadota bacterium]
MAAFTEQEYLQRNAAVKASMDRKGIDVLIINEAANMNYLTGFANSVYYHPTFVVVALDEEKPYWIGREYTDMPAARLSSYLPTSHIVSYSEDLANHFLVDEATRKTKDAMSAVVDFIHEKGWSGKTVGIEKATRLLSHAQMQSLMDQLTDCTLVDATTLVEWLRFVKSEAEVQCMREGAKIVDHAMAVSLANINDSARQCDVAGVAYHAMVTGTRDIGGCMPEGAGITNGASIPAIHMPWTDGLFERNALTNIELGGSRHFYNAALVRSAVLGKPHDDVMRLSDALLEGIEALLNKARPGVPLGEATRTFRTPIEKAGFRSRPWMGYSIGIGLPGQGWIDAPAGLTSDEETLFEANSTFHAVPCFWLDSVGGWAMMTSETFLIKKDGPAEALTQLERKLWII